MRRSVHEFGAFGDGVHDDYAAFQAAFDSGSGEIEIPQGTYLISRTLLVHSNTIITANRNAKIVMKSASRRKRNDFLLSNSDPETGNRNIRITGGIWDGNNTAPENAKPDLFDKDSYSGSMLNFVNVENLVMKDMVLANSVTYYARLCRVHHFEIENIDFVSDAFGKNQDGLHFGGDVKHGVVRNIRALSYGQTNDDMIAMNADDSIERVENLDLCRDTIDDITVENVYTENCHTIIRMLSVSAEIRNIRMKNIYGGFRCNAINADAARYCRTPLFKEEECPDGAGMIRDIYIENFTCFPVSDLPDDFGGTQGAPKEALRFESRMDNFNIEGFRYIRRQNDLQSYPAVKACHLVKQKISVDGKEFVLENKDDVFTMEDFNSIHIHSYE